MLVVTGENITDQIPLVYTQKSPAQYIGHEVEISKITSTLPSVQMLAVPDILRKWNEILLLNMVTQHVKAHALCFDWPTGLTHCTQCKPSLVLKRFGIFFHFSIQEVGLSQASHRLQDLLPHSLGVFLKSVWRGYEAVTCILAPTFGKIKRSDFVYCNLTSIINEGPVDVKFVQICFSFLLFSHDDESKNTK